MLCSAKNTNLSIFDGNHFWCASEKVQTTNQVALFNNDDRDVSGLQLHATNQWFGICYSRV